MDLHRRADVAGDSASASLYARRALLRDPASIEAWEAYLLSASGARDYRRLAAIEDLDAIQWPPEAAARVGRLRERLATSQR
jgi:hypothetical protein